MYDMIIKQYIERLTIEDVLSFAGSKGISLTNEEAKLLYQYTKSSWQVFYHGDPSDIMMKLKQDLRPPIYQALESLYYEYKDKIN